MTPIRPAIDRIALGVVVLASAWFAFAAAWGMFGAIGGGHLGGGASGNAMDAEQIVRWHIVYPAWGWHTGVAPRKADYYCHHPFGLYWVSAIFLWIFGHRDFVVRLPAVLMSLALPPLLYGIAKEKWGRPAGAVAAAAYVVVPIAVGFSSFNNLETICIFGALLFFWGHTRHMATGKRRHLVASLVGIWFTCSGDWVGYLIVAPPIVWCFVRGCVLPARLTPRVRLVPYLRWWAWSVASVAASLLLWLGLFYKADAISDWLMQAALRGGAEGTKLKDVLEARSAWIDFSFTPPAVWLGKIAAPVCLLRLLVTRLDEETYALGLLFGATVQYVAFKQAGDVHIFWAHYFAPYYALALAQLARTIGAAVSWPVRRLAPAHAQLALGAVTLTVGLLPTLAMAHDGVLSLWVWRRTGGRYDDNGSLIRSSVDAMDVLRQVVVPRVSPGMHIAVHPSLGWAWEHEWTYQGIGDTAMEPKIDASAWARPFWVARASGLSADEQKTIASMAHVRVYGDLWVVDQREAPAPLDAYSMNEREPGVFEWLLTHPTEPVRRIGDAPDPWITWEWRTHLGQDAPAPTGEPRTLDEMRIAHNVAVSRGDAQAAEAWREKIEARIDRTVTVKFERGVRLIGVRRIGGVQPRIESWFEVTDAPAGDWSWAVKSSVIARAPLSLIPPDKTDREMAWPPSLPTKLWKPGFFYTTQTVMNHRIGVERYSARWYSQDGHPAPRRAGGAETILSIVR
jgi:hypothetical protein